MLKISSQYVRSACKILILTETDRQTLLFFSFLILVVVVESEDKLQRSNKISYFLNFLQVH